MCGIALILATDGPLAARSPLQTPLQQMLSRQQHRGPDSQGEQYLPWGSGLLAMGSNRLRILDPRPAADQPMERQLGSKKGVLSYNGELYNYTELRNELLRLGCAFSSSSDTEVVLYALLAWGRSALVRFQGQFALAFWQQQEDQPPQLLLARDRWGQKPLYYSQQQGTWLAASELQGLLASGLVHKALHQEQVFHYLRYKYAARPHTFYRGIRELEPGHSLLLQPGADPLLEGFVPPAPTASLPESDQGVLDTVEELLIDALLAQLQSDVPVGLFLSGGVDSTLLLALLRQHAAWQLPRCFTLGNSAQEARWGTRDFEWAAKAARQYGAYHHPLALEADALLGRFGELASRQDQPIGDGAWLLTNLLSEFATSGNYGADGAAQGVKVVLSGAGADEAFGGYNRHGAFAWYLRNRNWLLPLFPLLESASGLFPTALPLPGRAGWQLAKKFSRNLRADPYQTYLNFTSLALLPPAERGPAERGPAERAEPQQPPDWLAWALEHDRHYYLTSDVLALNDRAGMQWGLELRQPYLHEPLWDFLARLPAHHLLKGGKKWILKALLERHGGKAYAQRPKQGFGPPFGGWVRGGKDRSPLAVAAAGGSSPRTPCYPLPSHKSCCRPTKAAGPITARS
ncbi:asparagine synthase (glutamine-hydrolyzing) [Cesiribacter andamanensis]|uniref:asparagine synthase (glutamine-hydrolyzing) n=1 Tax=Cesiribacter andamanensis AMV16 TaxID=1279009 RepID=M7MWL2_9BACT|nr:asparagine synthase (glutamine-hydrolyzing) [Cesiribacter andamanensis]EMR00793.1 Putative asparagine synthetase [Cesiribacter andamanensis AMV16]